MAQSLKHVGRHVASRKKVAVAYRVVPGEPENCLVVPTESLEAAHHDSLMKLIESNAGQNAEELADAMNRSMLPDGMNMLKGFHKYGKIYKMKTSEIQMTPDNKSSVMLDELNRLIADAKGITVADLAISGPEATTVAEVKSMPTAATTTAAATAANETVLDDTTLATQYRSQADALYKEAKRLREQAEELVPTKRKTKASAKET
jgi:hypothetical protein